MMNNDNEATFRFLRAHGISLGLVFTVLLQLIGFVIWLTKQGEAVARLQEDHAEMTRRIDMLDQAGPRPTQLIQQRILTVEAANTAQDARLRELETRVSEIHRQVVENRIWIDQIVAACGHSPTTICRRHEARPMAFECKAIPSAPALRKREGNSGTALPVQASQPSGKIITPRPADTSGFHCRHASRSRRSYGLGIASTA